MNSFLPTNYEVPEKKTNYLKFKKNDKKYQFRVVSSAIVGYLYWNTEDKPVRLKQYPNPLPLDIKVRDKSTPQKEIKHFWAFVVIDREDGAIKVLELTQSTIMDFMKDAVDDPQWGDPRGYDFSVKRFLGSNEMVKYTTTPCPHKTLTPEEQATIKATPVNLEALFSGGDPFEISKPQVEQRIVEDGEPYGETNPYGPAGDSVDDFEIDLPEVYEVNNK